MFGSDRDIVGRGGTSASRSGEVILAGKLGYNLDLTAASTLGLLPKIKLGRYRKLLCPVLDGASRALMQPALLEKIEELRPSMRHVELAEHPDFQRRFIQALDFNRRG